MTFAQLVAQSNYSFLQSASHPEELVIRAAELGYEALAITDECSLAGVVKAHMACKALPPETPLKLIIGSLFRLEGDQLVCLATNRQGYAELSSLITLARRRAEKGHYRLEWQDLTLPHCLLLWRPLLPEQADRRAIALKAKFSQRLWLMAPRILVSGEAEYVRKLEDLGARLHLPLVAADPVQMHDKARKPLLDIVHCIHLGCTLDQAGWRLPANAEAYLKPLPLLQKRHKAAWLGQTQVVASRCNFSLDEVRYQYPAEVVPNGLTAATYLRQEVQKGARRRFGAALPIKVGALLEKELQLIDELKYHYYFLTLYDIVRFAKQKKILHQGRGSAANSVVCYCLGITEVDPTKVELLFERFLSKERDEPPDIDVDFEHQRREEVVQYLYQKYGRDRAALAATVVTYRFKSAMRDVGMVLELDATYVDHLIRRVDRRDPTSHWQKQLVELGVPAQHPLLFLVQQLMGFPRHLSQHVGGFVIAATPLSELVPVENAAMKDRTVIQWDKDDLEALGLLKVDVLALGMLSAIRRCFDLIGQWRGKPMEMADVAWEQPEVYDMLCRADSIGVFQIESRAQSNMLPRLQPRCYYDLVVQIAIVRPGPIQGNMVHPYLKRRHKLEPVQYPSPEVKQVLSRTLGVPIFQEQVIKLAMIAAGFSGGEADRLRRAMASWKRHGELDQFEHKLKLGMAKRGYSEEFAEQIFRQIRGFGEYGFPESHSASFALLAYVSAWLKHHYPVAFTCALLNSQPMGFYTPSQLVQDLRRHNGRVLPISVNQSTWDHQVVSLSDNDNCENKVMALRLGFRLLKGFSFAAAEALIRCRPKKGYSSINELIRLTTLDKASLEVLASANALEALAGHRYQSQWELAGEVKQLPLFANIETETEVSLAPPSEAEAIDSDLKHIGVNLGRHPVELLREKGKLLGCLNAQQLLQCRHGALVQIAGLVVGRQRPGTASGVTFITLEDETGNTNIVVWADTARAQRQPFLTARLLQVKGILEREGEVIHVVAGRLQDRSREVKSLLVTSRDFR